LNPGVIYTLIEKIIWVIGVLRRTAGSCSFVFKIIIIIKIIVIIDHQGAEA